MRGKALIKPSVISAQEPSVSDIAHGAVCRSGGGHSGGLHVRQIKYLKSFFISLLLSLLHPRDSGVFFFFFFLVDFQIP